MIKLSKKHLTSLFLALVILLSICPSIIYASEYALTGNGTEDSPYLINNSNDLIKFKDLIDNTPSSKAFAKLTSDIDLSAMNWIPFNPSSGYVTEAFAGTFDGDYHTIKGLNVNSSESNQGLFGVINGAVIKNLCVEGSVLSSGNYTGGIVGKIQQGTVENCSFTGSIVSEKNKGYAGGITGYAGNSKTQTAKISGCANNAAVKSESGGTAGGIAGYAKYTNIQDCYNTGEISGAGRSGGIAGQLQNECAVSNCYNAGNILNSRTAADICDFLYSSSSLANCHYITLACGAGSGTVTDCSAIDNNLLSKLGGRFEEDKNNINNGYPILAWQTNSAPSQKNPHIEISGKSTLYMTNNAEPVQTALTVNYIDMDNTSLIKWSVSNPEILSLENPENPKENNSSVLITALAPGKSVVSAETEDNKYYAEYEISVIPFITTVEIDGTAAVSQTVRAKINILGGTEYDYNNYPELDIQWKYLTDENYSNGNTGSDSYKNIPGASGRKFTITNDLENCYLSFSLWYNGEYITPGSPVPILSEENGIITMDKESAVIDTSDIKSPKTLELPDLGENGSSITWTSSVPDIINPNNGEVTLPESGICEVTLSALFTYGSAKSSKIFTINVYSVKAAEEENSNKLLTLENIIDSLGNGYAMYPVFGKDTNVYDILNADIAEHTDLNVKSSIKSIREIYEGASISENGDISYFYADPNTAPAIKMGSYKVTFTLSLDSVSKDLEVPVIIYWNAEKVKNTMRSEILDKTVLDETKALEENISLPKVIDGKKWVQITWSSSDENILSISNENQQTADTLFNPYVGVVRRGFEDKKVTLTAAFKFMLTNDFTGVEEPIYLNKVFVLTVKALDEKSAEDIKKQLDEKLETGFTKKELSDSVSGEALKKKDGKYIAYDDILFPTTNDFEIDGKYCPVSITSSNENVIVPPDTNNAARVQVLRPAKGSDDAEASVTISIRDKNSNISASKTFDIIIPALTQEEIDAEKALMQKVKNSYFEGIKGKNTASNNISQNLSAFLEAYEQDGEIIWVRNNNEITNIGIVPVPMEGWEELEAWRLFKSSNPAAVSHENLIVSMQQNAKAVTVSSALSSERFGKYGELFKKDPITYSCYADLSDLYYQEVSANVVIRGTSTKSNELPVAVTETIDVSFKLQSDKNTLISKVTYNNLYETATVYDIFKQALADNGYTFKSRGSYVYSIATPYGEVLEEFDEGSNSGWMYKVNGKIPNVYMGAYGLKDGDSVVVYFTKDYTEGKGGTLGVSSSKNPETDITNPENNTISGSESGDISDIQYSDVTGHWAEETIYLVSRFGLMTGIGDDKFAPDEALSRAMFVTILYRLEGEPQTSVSAFSDVEKDIWYESAVSWASKHGIIYGITDTKFAPDTDITREQMAAILYRYAEFKQLDLSKSDYLGYSDSSNISDFAAEAVLWSAKNGIMIGNDDNRFEPKSGATRAQAAVVFLKLSDIFNNK